MRLFALSDPHLSHSVQKPMDIFGSQWKQHAATLEKEWRFAVSPGDLVLIPGDISWALRLEDAIADLEFLHSLPGKKLIMRGNHDYWWSSLTKVRACLPDSIYALQNDCFTLPGLTVCGARGWLCPGGGAFSAEDQKLYEREGIRLELSLKAAKSPVTLAMSHYPPFNEKREQSVFTRLYSMYGVKRVVYGHLHGKSCGFAFEGSFDGVQYSLVSADHLGFAPKLLGTVSAGTIETGEWGQVPLG